MPVARTGLKPAEPGNSYGVKNPRSGLRMDASEGLKVWVTVAGSGEEEAVPHPKRKDANKKRVNKRFKYRVPSFMVI